MTILRRRPLTVKTSPIHGFGVFSDVDLFPGDVIEDCYYPTIAESDHPLVDYTFKLKSADDSEDYAVVKAMPLGYAAIYNHADIPNATYSFNSVNQVMTIVANRPIQCGEEIFVSYGSNWFESRDMKSVQIEPPRLRFAYRVKWFLHKNMGYLRMLFGSAAILGAIQLLRELSLSFVVGN